MAVMQLVLIDAPSLALKEKLSKHVGVASWFQELIPASNSFVNDDRIVWVSVEGLHIKALTHNTFAKILSPWGDFIDVEAPANTSLSYKKICVKTKNHVIINDRIKIIVKGKVYWIRVKELEPWIPDFNHELEDNSSSDEESEGDISEQHHETKKNGAESDNDLEIDHVSETSYMNENDVVTDNHVSESGMNAKCSEDPFGICKLLNSKKAKEASKGEDPLFPPGFTPIEVENLAAEINVGTSEVTPSKPSSSNGCISRSKSDRSHVLKYKPGGSILDLMENLIEVGQTMGFNMEGCMKIFEDIVGFQGEQNVIKRIETKMESIDLITIKELWGNSSFDYAFSLVVGFSGGILSVWNPNLFIKESVTISDHFLAIHDTWISSDTRTIIINVYAPQDLSDRKALWDYIKHFVDSWSGESIILEDFNEVRSENERLGFIFYENGANAFNHFITRAGLIDLPLEGYSFTWTHPSASKMSKLDRFLVSEGMIVAFSSLSAICLERYLSDHRPILLRELDVDYGPSPFRLYHSWYSKDGFDDLVEQTWKSPIPNESNSKFPSGCNASFITLIPKTQDSKLVKDFRPISLIGSIYKIITKIMANRITLVISDLVSDVQSAFVAGRQILDGKREKSNISTLVNVLNCFSMASGLKINLYKSKLRGIGVKVGGLTLSKAVLRFHPLFNMFYVSCSHGYSEQVGVYTLFALEDDKLVSVSDKLQAPSLLDSFRRPPCGGIEDSQLTSLAQDLAAVVLSNIPSYYLSHLLASLGVKAIHIFFNCHVARDLLSKVARWWELELLDIHAYEDWLSWLITLRLSKRLKDILKGHAHRSQSRNSNRQQQQVPPTFVEPFNLVEPIENQAPPVVTMADNRTMAQLLEAPTEGYEDAIVVPEITADNFELKHDHFYDEVPERPEYVGYRFQQRFDETFYEAWDRFNDLLRACPHHGFSELHQLDTFYNALNSNDQDSLNSAAGGNFLDKIPRDCLRIIESKFKVHNSRNKPVVAKVSSSSSTPGISPDVAELKDMVKALLLDKKNQSQAPAPVKAVEESCVTCGGAHSYQNCPATDGNVYRDNIQEYVSQAAATNFNHGYDGVP
ncbi:RNA-directed DNA polymerase, eukaryota [Tanacetum coccineum]